MTAGQIAHHLHGRRSGAGFVARCPAHDDRTPSLSLKDTRDGKLLVRCHAGCPQETVVEILKDRGMWPEEPRKRRVIVAEYNYTEANGKPLYQVVRFEPKGFAQRYDDGHGGWTWKKHPNQVLYRLPEVLEAPIVFLVEGEKDVETLRSHGFVATTNAGGANARWLPQFTDALRGLEVNIIPDNDVPGWQRATDVARALFGTASLIRVVDLPKETKDISDWFSAGHGECELIAMLEGAHAV